MLVKTFRAWLKCTPPRNRASGRNQRARTHRAARPRAAAKKALCRIKPARACALCGEGST